MADPADPSPCHRSKDRHETHVHEPEDPLTRPLFAAEHVAGDVVKQILTDGGHLLWERYLERKAYPFAVKAIVEVVVSSTAMCYIHCEGPEDMDPEDWGIEVEPQPSVKDSWARMALSKKDDSKMRNTFTSTKDSFGVPKKRSKSAKLSSSGALDRRMSVTSEQIPNAKSSKKAKEELPRSWSLDEKPKLDPEEERYREAKSVDDHKKREAEKRHRLEKKAAEHERIRIEALHEEMEKRPHTFDLNGGVLWIEPPNLAKLPKVQEGATYNVKSMGSTKSRALDESANGSKTVKFNDQPPPPKPARNARGRKKKKPEAEDFPDSFVPLSYGQPPILETMQVKSGVSLVHKGKDKKGPPREITDGKMSRLEYGAFSQREISGDTQLQFTQSGGVRAVGGNSGNSPSESTSSPTGKKDASPKAQKGDADMNGASSPQGAKGDSLPALDQGRPPASQAGDSSPSKNGAYPGGMVLGGSGAGVAPGDVSALVGNRDRDLIQASPMAPPIYTRARKFESVGHLGRPPRVHPPSLGKLDVFSNAPKATQPPLGATMGHGLMRHQSSVEEYFFPPLVPDSPMMQRAKSEADLPRERSESDSLSKSPSHGSIIPDQRSPAYRNVRKQLFARDPNRSGGSFVS